MEYQQLPPVSMIIGSPANSVQHVINGSNNSNGSNQLLTMQPPLIPLQVAHNLHQLTSHNPQNGLHHGNNQNQNVQQPLPPTTQLLQAIHNNTQQQQHQQNNVQLQQQQQQNNVQNISGNNNGTTNNNNNVITDDNNRWTQYQVQQLWRHHAYLNGNDNRTRLICSARRIFINKLCCLPSTMMGLCRLRIITQSSKIVRKKKNGKKMSELCLSIVLNE